MTREQKPPLRALPWLLLRATYVLYLREKCGVSPTSPPELLVGVRLGDVSSAGRGPGVGACEYTSHGLIGDFEMRVYILLFRPGIWFCLFLFLFLYVLTLYLGVFVLVLLYLVSCSCLLSLVFAIYGSRVTYPRLPWRKLNRVVLTSSLRSYKSD